MTCPPRHGHAKLGQRTPEYQAWANMLRRCTNPRHPQYGDYGGRGITVCDRWFKFDNFIADIGLRPTGMSLERVDNSRGYAPDNCEWASRKRQSNNTRITTIIEVGGARRPLSEVCEELGLNKSTVRKRVFRSGWSWEQALTPPLWKR